MIAEAIERLEERYPHLPDTATQGHVREGELRLQKEIEQLRADLKFNIEQIHAKLREPELLLQKAITHIKLDLLEWLVPFMFARVAAIAAFVKLL